jgi:N-acyl-D-aspartate/D-glutamate deacylase
MADFTESVVEARERGMLRAGAYAVVVIFDPETIGDRATFEDPHQPSVGVRDVWVNGQRVLKDGEHTGATPGRVVDEPAVCQFVLSSTSASRPVTPAS